jgi:CHAT domain-containing protein
MRSSSALLVLLLAGCAHQPPAPGGVAAGVALRNQGDIQLSIDTLAAARRNARTPEEGALAAGELGASLLAARRTTEARAALEEAYRGLAGAERGRYALDLGNLALAEKKPEEARSRFEEARALAGGNAALEVTADLQLARQGETPARVAMIEAAAHALAKAGGAEGRLHLNVGVRAIELGSLTLDIAAPHLERARAIALERGDLALLLEADDALSQMHEDADRIDAAMALVDEALARGAGAAPGVAGMTRVQLLWRQGRLAQRQKRPDLARAAYIRAVDEIEAIRPDIPIDFEDGQSSFRKTLSPIYLGLADLLLRQSSGQAPAERAQTLKRVRGVVELVKQTELQDYLGDRCLVETDAVGGVAAHTAILYPIIFADRLELLLETAGGIERFTSPVSARVLTRTATDLAETLRRAPRGGMQASQDLYDWLIRPLRDSLAAQSIATLVVVPDGVLRLVPMAALNDGQHYLIEALAVATIPGLTMTNVTPPKGRSVALMAGLSEPGPVVDRLPKGFTQSVLGAEGTRSPSQIKDALSLPGVKREIEGLAKLLPGDTLMDSGFTARQFERSFNSSTYQVVHIASHGVFGGSAAESFIMTYDELLTMDRLQSLLGESANRKAPIELLTLSACETAEGDDRSPLGISGAALKAHAKSAVGTLWPVEDTAAEKVMQAFYAGLGSGRGKAEALRQAQLRLLRDDRYSHPFFWAPFIVVGNWL